jgi:hypothetical protein
MAETSYKRFLFARHAKFSALLMTLILHALLVILGFSVVVVAVNVKKERPFVVQEVGRSPPPMKLTTLKVPVNIRKASPPKPRMNQPRLIKTELQTVDINMSDMVGMSWDLGLPDSGVGLSGLGLGQNISFFGIKGGGTHVVFILDCSQSMSGEKEKIMRREAVRIIEDLPMGTQFAVIFFAGPAWPAGSKPDLDDWVQTYGDFQSFRPKNWDDLPKVKYRRASEGIRSGMIRHIRSTPLVYGTVFDCPIFMALRMDPIPDTVFFMTDGECSTERGINSLRKMVEQLKAAGKRIPVMNTVGFGIGRNYQLEDMAALMMGECSFISIQDYIMQHGPVPSGYAAMDSGFDVERRVKSVPAGEYPVEFSLP